jgi:outer membrane protein assembly factor BamB
MYLTISSVFFFLLYFSRMKTASLKNLLILLLVFLIGCVSASDNNWPQFRGSNSLGIAPKNATPSLELNLNKNLSWKTSLASGVSSPCVYKNMIFITGFDKEKKVLITYCVDFVKGSVLWQKLVIPDSIENGHSVSSPAATTPVIWHDQVILHRNLELSSLFLKDGSEAWSMGVVTTGIGTPVIVNDTLYLNGFLNMGESGLYDDMPDFNTMLLKYDLNRDKLINISEIPEEWAFFRRPELNLNLGYDAFYPIRDVALSFDLSGDKTLSGEEWEKLREFHSSFKLEHGTVVYKLEDSTGMNKPSLIWKQKEFVSEVPSLLVKDNRVFMIMDGGTFTCFKASSGDVFFRERIKAPGPYIASPLYANGYVYLIAYNGKVTVVKAGDKLNIVSRSDLKENVAASPVALSNLLLVRTENTLYAFKN